jgi:threonine dehydrogenase-like Zn-dependent dehydrogenase
MPMSGQVRTDRGIGTGRITSTEGPSGQRLHAKKRGQGTSHIRGARGVWLLLLTSLLFIAPPAFADAIGVDCSSNPSALQPAIDAAPKGATLEISGTCVGTFLVSKER